MKRMTLVAGAMLLLLIATTGVVAANGDYTYICGEPTVFPLYAGQDIEVGTISISNNVTTLFVTYNTTGSDWYITETHLAAGNTSADIPLTKKGNPIPGQFPYSDCWHYVKEVSYEIPFSEIAGEFDPDDGCLVIAAHAVVVTKDQFCMDIYSDEETIADANSTTVLGTEAVEAWQPYDDDDNTYWDNHIDYAFSDDAKWIWQSYRTLNPIDGDYVEFNKTFTIPGGHPTGTIHITCDNGYELYVNDELIGSAQVSGYWKSSDFSQAYVDTTNWQSVESYVLDDYLQPGLNTIIIYAANEQMKNGVDGQSDGTIESNPAGLIYEAEICYTAITQEETAWAANDEPLSIQFPGSNWATYVEYCLQQCFEEVCLPIVSDQQTNVTANTTGDLDPFPAIPTWQHAQWIVNVNPTFEGSGATWIWESEYVNSPVATGAFVKFERTFTIDALEGSIVGSMIIAADNAYEFSINGYKCGTHNLPGDGWLDGYFDASNVTANEWQTIGTYDISNSLQSGENTIVIYGVNAKGSDSAISNPAGVIYEAEICYETPIEW